jgi:hypothetical protein
VKNIFKKVRHLRVVLFGELSHGSDIPLHGQHATVLCVLLGPNSLQP